jgi:deoxyhypusine synthase
VVYTDSTIALPLLTHYILAKGTRRTPKRLYERLPDFMELLRQNFAEKKEERIAEGMFEI